MNLLLISLILLLAFFAISISSEIGVPSLIVFLMIGVFFNLRGFEFRDFDTAIDFATLALIIITFYAGFVINGDTLESSIRESLLLSTVGVLITAGAVGLFVHFVFGFGMWESMLLGAIVGSTDAAGIFSMLRSDSLNLKYDTTPLISFESGANDTVSKSLTFAFIATMGMGIGPLSAEFVKLVLIGLMVGYIFSYIFSKILPKIATDDEATTAIFLLTALFLTYSITDVLGGNGFVAAYVLGLFLGNIEFTDKFNLVSFFESLSGIMEVGFFFLVGVFLEIDAFLVSLPIAIGIILFITFVARPLAVMPILSAFKRPTNQKLFVSFAGFRGSTAIILALKALHLDVSYDLLQVVFGIVISSFIIQNFGLPFVAKRLDMLDESLPVRRTFNDYIMDSSLGFLEIDIEPNSSIEGMRIQDLDLGGLLIGKIVRDGEKLIPHGNTVLMGGDSVVVTGKLYTSNKDQLIERTILPEDPWVGKTLSELSVDDDLLVIGLMRNDKVVVPSGSTQFQAGDKIVVSKQD